MANEKTSDSPLPSEIMPSCWNEENRINALFSPFRSKSANPQDWSSKYKFWKSLIFEWLRFKMRCSFTLAELTNNFKKEGRTPHCLPTVIEELLRSGDIVLESDFLKETSETWVAWSLDLFVKKPFTWSFTKVKNFIIDSEIDKDAAYVHLQIIKELGDIVMSILQERKGYNLVSFAEIVKDCTYNINNSIIDNSVMLALIWLKRNKKITYKSICNQSELLVKISKQPTDVITEVDEGLYILIKQENELLRQIQLMEEEKLKVVGEVKSYLAKSMRQIARLHLRKKIQLEKAIEKQAQILENLQLLISDIKNSHTNIAVLSAYKIGSDTLKKLADEGLTESNVTDIMNEISESLDEQQEVQAILSNTLNNSEFDVDLEKELEELIALDEPLTPSKPDVQSKFNIEEIEQRMQNLNIKDLPIETDHSKTLSQESTKKRKVLSGIEST